MSSARALNATGPTSFVRSLSLATKLKEPNEMTSLFGADGPIMASPFVAV
jgi:hypothetical protein